MRWKSSTVAGKTDAAARASGHARFFVAGPLAEGKEYVISDPGLVRQITRVFRLRTGAALTLLDGSGFEFAAVMGAVGPKKVACAVREKRRNEHEPRAAVTIYQSIIKKDNMEWVVEKCTELGVVAIVPVVAARSVKTGVSLDRLRAAAREAAEQSRRGKIPAVESPMPFAQAVRRASGTSGACNILFDGIADGNTQARCAAPTTDAPVNFFIGPEGGFRDEEILLAAEHGFSVCGLGPRTLRSETAAVAAAFALVT